MGRRVFQETATEVTDLRSSVDGSVLFARVQAGRNGAYRAISRPPLDSGAVLFFV
jgi:hypothetical protein